MADNNLLNIEEVIIQLETICKDNTLSLHEKINDLFSIFNALIIDITNKENIYFVTLFSRISYICYKNSFSKKIKFVFHSFRITYHQSKPSEYDSYLFELGLKSVGELLIKLYKLKLPASISRSIQPDIFFKYKEYEYEKYKSEARFHLIQIDTENEFLVGIDEDYPHIEIKVKYNILEKNELYTPAIKSISKIFILPFYINLIQIDIDENGVYYPKGFVFVPDYLVDVTAIAECFKSNEANPLGYLLRKLLPKKASIHTTLGNAINLLLDELLADTEKSFEPLLLKIFKLDPIMLSTKNNEDIKHFSAKLEEHFENLKYVIKNDLPEAKIKTEFCYIEPSFYAQKYGLQGRLDVFYQHPVNTKESAIIELKSGKVFKPNKYGLNQNHYTQTLLYDLIIESTFKQQKSAANFILYSVEKERRLRYAPAIKQSQMEALVVRNYIISIDQILCNILDKNDLSKISIFERLFYTNNIGTTGYERDDMVMFEEVYKSAPILERKYFHAFLSFIAREHRIAKTGIQGITNTKGVASLWLQEAKEKAENFEIIENVKISENHINQDNPYIVFEKTLQTSELANFRIGDIVVFYPSITADKKSVLNNQLFKATLIENEKNRVVVRLKSRQFNTEIFQKNEFWNIEHDMLDSGFGAMYRSLFSFLQADTITRSKILGIIPPDTYQLVPMTRLPLLLTEEQKNIVKKIISAEDYFLLWGPPGTGKTSVMLRTLVHHYFYESKSNILLLSYTNRAVDEICEVLIDDENIKQSMLRIGSRYSCDNKFHNLLLDHKLEPITKRKEVIELFETHRIFVATVSSFINKQELLQLKKFDFVVIDEASQIQEPMLVGILPKFAKYLLIGDHKQLPAVVTQSEESSKVLDLDLHKIGLSNLRNSYFERIFKICKENKWEHAYDQLSQQGRMHIDIMKFVSDNFYGSKLKILPVQDSKLDRQNADLNLKLPPGFNNMEEMITSKRLMFFDTPKIQIGNSKTNKYEAQLATEIILSYKRVFEHNQIPFDKNKIGIITPYRAQIAQIRSQLIQHDCDINTLTIDTVERYQGGARDIIILSLCTNSNNQFKSLISLDDEGTDRKLNVALTRTREQIIILGNREILLQNKLYAELLFYIENYHHIS